MATGNDLMKFLDGTDWKKSTRFAYKTACSRVLRNGDFPLDSDLTPSVVEKLALQFLTNSVYKSSTAGLYAGRLKRLVAIYNGQRQLGRRMVGGCPPDTLKHTFPVREGVVATFVLPMDLTQTEVDRLVTFLKMLPYEPAGEKR